MKSIFSVHCSLKMGLHKQYEFPGIKLTINLKQMRVRSGKIFEFMT